MWADENKKYVETLHILSGKYFSIIMQRKLIIEDKLLQWSNKNKKIFAGIDGCQNNQIQNIRLQYNLSYWQNEMNRPAPWADPYIIAMAICEQAMIITQEHKTKSNRIPPIASQFGIRSLNLLEFFQELKIKL